MRILDFKNKTSLRIAFALAVVLQVSLAAYIWNVLQESQSSHPVTSEPAELQPQHEADPILDVYKRILLTETIIDASKWKVKPQFFAYLAQRQAKDVKEFIAPPEVDDSVVQYLAGFPLVKLVLNRTNITRASVPLIGSMSGLDYLEINGLKLTPDDLKLLMKPKMLMKLKLTACDLNDDCLKQFGSHNFSQLILYENLELGDRGLDYLLQQPLIELDLRSTGVSDKSVMHLNRMQSLEKLFLASDKITDRSLPYITQLRKLSSLDLGRTLITDHGLSVLKPPALNVLGISYCKALTADGIKRFQKRMPSCTVSAEQL